MHGEYLETLAWPEAETALRKFAIALLPIGARAKEHGLHLPLNTDWLLAEYLTGRVLEQFPAVALPTVQYGYYPAFVEYPGSIHIQRDAFEGTICDICRSLARHGTQKIYVLNTGISTNWALEPARLQLQRESITMEYTDLRSLHQDVAGQLQTQVAGTHADEIETSVMLYIHPEVVNLQMARSDIDPRRSSGALTRDPDSEQGIYSPTGAWGDPTLATREKGEAVVEVLVQRIVASLKDFAGDDYSAAPPRQEYL